MATKNNPWSEFLSCIRTTNPVLTPEVTHIFDDIEREQPFIYWCPNSGKKYEPLIFDVPVPQNPLCGRLYRLGDVGAQGRKTPGDKILVWVNDSVTQNWIEPDHVEVDLCLSPEIVAHLRTEWLQRLQQPIKNQDGKDELRDFGVLKACITNPQTRFPGGDTYLLLFSMVKSEAMVKQVFASRRLHVHVAALVESDLRQAGESAESIFRLLNDYARQVGDWRYLIAPKDTRLPGWTTTRLHKDGWGHDTLWLWTGHQPAKPVQKPAPVVQKSVPPDNAWACAMMRAVKNPQADIQFTITVEGHGSMRWPCSRFLKPLAAEEQVIPRHLGPLNDNGGFSVLDIGCGVGRHLRFIRDNFSNARLFGTETHQTLRNYCEHEFGATMMPNLVWPGYYRIQASELDVVLLLGNGIGLYENPQRLEAGLNHIFEMLRPGGVLIGECGSLPDTARYSENKVTITFEKARPVEFQWLFCDWTWLRPMLKHAGFEIVSDEDISIDEPGGCLFVAKKPSYPQKYYERVLQQLRPEDRAASSGKTRFFTLEDVLRVAQSRSARLPRGTTAEDHVRYQTAKNRVLLYPACGVDWEPLYRFSGRCDTIIYCDHNRILERVVDEVRKLPQYLQVDHSVLIPQDFVQAMTSDSDGATEVRRQPSIVDPLGFLLLLTCHATNPPKKLHLLYFSVEGVTLYSNLFARRAHPFLKRVWAPEYLCIKRNTARFEVWQNPLGRLVDTNRSIPRFLVTGEVDGGCDWPWNIEWLRFPIWHEEIAGSVRVSHRPGIVPTEREGRDFCLPGIPQTEWPDIAAARPQPPLG